MAAVSVGPFLTTTPDSDSFAEPLDALLAEHFRQRAMCDLLDRLARDLSNPCADAWARAILTYLREQLPQNLASLVVSAQT